MARKTEVDTGFLVDSPDFPFATPPDRLGLTYQPLHRNERDSLKEWFAGWVIKPRFSLADACPANLITFAGALEVVGCILFAYRVEVTAKAKIWGDPSYFVESDSEEERLAQAIEEIISEPEYEPFLEVIRYRLGWPRDYVAQGIAGHHHEDNGQYFESITSKSFDHAAYGEYKRYCEAQKMEVLPMEQWLYLRADAERRHYQRMSAPFTGMTANDT